jgi:hypothetical protein
MWSRLAKFFEHPSRAVLWAPVFIGIPLIVALYGAARGSFDIFVVALAVSAAAYAVGGFVGFLFGIPRALTTAGEGAQPKIDATVSGTGTEPTIPIPVIRYGPNTNLEQISDWLTKLLIGAGLVQLGQLRGSLADLVEFLKPALGNDDMASVYALSEVLYFLIAGFVCGWTGTRLWLQDELEKRDEKEREAIKEYQGLVAKVSPTRPSSTTPPRTQ